MRGATLCVVLAILTVGCERTVDGCVVEDVLSRAEAPNSNVEAVLFESRCGLRAIPEWGIDVLNPSEVTPEGHGDIFVAYRPSDSTYVRMEWTGADSLLIAYGNAQVYVAEELYSGVTIAYINETPDWPARDTIQESPKVE